MAEGGRQPELKKPVSAPAPAPAGQAAPSGIENMPIPPEPDKPLCVNLNEFLDVDKNRILENADILTTTMGKIATTRVVLVQANGDIKPHYHTLHDEIIYVVKGKAILTIGEDRHVGAPGTVFVVPRRSTYSFTNTGEKPFVAVVIEVPPADPKDVYNVRVR
jgi:mannose-6-phosphate isomerase-like protein (cupin superfamily)